MRRHVVVLVVLLALVGGRVRQPAGDGDSGRPGRRRRQRVDGEFTTDVGDHRRRDPIGVIADISGVVPGLFGAAPEAVEAYAAMVNEDGGINGRDLVVEVFDTETTDAGNAAAYEEACPKVFASVGSESAFDTGGLDAAARVRVPGPRRVQDRPRRAGAAERLPAGRPRLHGRGRGAVVRRGVPRGGVERGDLPRHAAGDRARRREPHRGPRVGRVGLQLPPAHRAAREQLHAARARDAEPGHPGLRLRGRREQHRAAPEGAGPARVRGPGRRREHAGLHARLPRRGRAPTARAATCRSAHALFEEADEIPALAEYIEWLEKVVPRRRALVERPDRLGARQALRRSRRGRGRGPHAREAHGGARVASPTGMPTG